MLVVVVGAVERELPVKPPNKPGEPGAEVVEGRGLPEGNTAGETRPGRSAGLGVDRRPSRRRATPRSVRQSTAPAVDYRDVAKPSATNLDAVPMTPCRPIVPPLKPRMAARARFSPAGLVRGWLAGLHRRRG